MMIDFVHENRALLGDAVLQRQVSAFKGLHEGLPCTIKATDKVANLTFNLNEIRFLHFVIVESPVSFSPVALSSSIFCFLSSTMMRP